MIEYFISISKAIYLKENIRKYNFNIFRLFYCRVTTSENLEYLCYKTKVWTDFGKIRVRTEIRYSSSYIISLWWEKEDIWLGSHMTWCHRHRVV